MTMKMSSISNSVKVTLYILAIVGTIGTWGRAAVDGSLARIFDALLGGDQYILPGTSSTLKTSFTGLYWPVDFLLDVLVVFFWEAVDGSHPTTSTIGVYFLGQLFPVLVTFYIAYLRYGSGSSIIKPTLWALSFQLGAIGCLGSFWALSFLTSSPTASSTISLESLKSACQVDTRTVWFILPALILGYFGSAIAMGLPSPYIVSNNFQQWALVIWNMYPILVAILFYLFVALADLGSNNHTQQYQSRSTTVDIKTSNREKKPDRSVSKYLSTIRIVFTITLIISSAIHIAILSISVTSTLFPAIFAPEFRQQFSISSLFLPPISFEKGNTVGDGIRSFFLWDQVAGYSIVLLVALLQLRSLANVTGKQLNWAKYVGAILLGSCVVGPGSMCAVACWFYDETLFGGWVE